MSTTSRRLSIQSGKKNSHTPGRTKQANCQADARKKFFMCSPKARKHKEYSHWHELAIKLNHG
jgi:hypothetical protein